MAESMSHAWRDTALYTLLLRQLTAHRPAIFAISGAQGSGKSTLAADLKLGLAQAGLCCGVVSLDDYYLGLASRRTLARQVHPLLLRRGVPGTHQTERLLADLQRHLQGQPLALPRFDKAIDDSITDLPLRRYDMLLIEGWCLGLLPVQATQLDIEVNACDLLPDAASWRHYQNDQLRHHYLPIWQWLKPMIYLQAPDWQTVCRWRQQQEMTLLQQRGTAMSDAELQQFLLPFQRWTELMLAGHLASDVAVYRLAKDRSWSG